MSSNVVTRINEIASMTADMNISETCGVGGHVLCEVSAFVKDQKLRRDMIRTGETIVDQVRRAPGKQLSAQESHMALLAISDKLTMAKPHLAQAGTANMTRLVNGAILRCEWLLGRNHDLVWSAANQNTTAPGQEPTARRPDADADRRAKKVERKKRRGVKMKLKPGMTRRGPGGPGM